MRIILSPAKKMNVDTDSFAPHDLSRFLPEAETLKTTLCKMPLGHMVRWLAEHNVTERSDIRQFNELGYQFASGYSTDTNDVFIKEIGVRS